MTRSSIVIRSIALAAMFGALEDICLIGCNEYDDLKRAIAAYKQLASR